MKYRQPHPESNVISRRTERVVVVGAGIGGLSAALELAACGLDVTVLERGREPGGKIREVEVSGQPVDSGPTVLTMRWVFDELFAAAGECLDAHITLHKAEILARHAWSADERLDLYADPEQSAEAIATFSSPAEARRFLSYCERAKETYLTLRDSFIRAPQPTPLSLALSAGLRGIGDLWRISPFTTMWSALGKYFRDPRLRQLFGRYATYCGSSPFEAPATLMLVSHVEQEGVYLIDGGMHRLAVALEHCARAKGARFRYDCEVREIIVENGAARGAITASGERVDADIVLVNADTAAVAKGHLGTALGGAIEATMPCARSLSAITFSMVAKTHGVPLVRHNVFFSRDYRKEFDEIFGARRIPTSPTIYVCAQDRSARITDVDLHDVPERLLCLINAPPTGDARVFQPEEIERCQNLVLGLLRRSGLTIEPAASVATTPKDFDRLYPATGGALYGQASHGWTASFTRPTARTKIPALYLAGGSTHPGPGLPMAGLSGHLAATSILEDLTSASPPRKAGTSGGTSTA
jgi:1-hydroxycarotenoid 3,4-desaturase